MLGLLTLILAVLAPDPAWAKNLRAAFRAAAPQVAQEPEDLPEVLAQPTPQTVEDLQDLEAHLALLADRLRDATVAVLVSNGTGSGVIISEEGYVLTAGHVFEEPGAEVVIQFPDGSRASGEALGHHVALDAGLCKITDEAPEGGWPIAPIGRLEDAAPGDYVMAIGHPGGYDPDRPFVVRLGRLIAYDAEAVQTDCALVGGDSGGPLFDMQGRVIGIHARIAQSTNGNYHIPIGTYLHNWNRLVDGQLWYALRDGTARLGVTGRPADGVKGLLITAVEPNSPAARQGLRAGDIVLRYDATETTDMTVLDRLLRDSLPGQEAVLKILRDGDTRWVRITLGRDSRETRR